MTDLALLKTVDPELLDCALGRWKGLGAAHMGQIPACRAAALTGEPASAEMLDALCLALHSPPAALAETVCLIARILVAQEQSAFSLILSLTRSRSAQGRANALLCMPPETPDAMARPVLLALLHDRSRKVKELAVDWISRHNLKQHLPLLEGMLSGGTSLDGFESHLAREVCLMKHGHHVSRGVGSVYVTIDTPCGRFGGFVDGQQSQGLSDQQIADAFTRRG